MKIALTSDLHYGFLGTTEKKIRKMIKNLSEENVDLLIIAGDIATVNQHQFKRCMEEIRAGLSCDIVYVRGNHDLWDRIHKKDKLSGTRNLQQIYNHHQEITYNLAITHLDEGPFSFDDGRVEVYGFDGWYAEFDPGTNDAINMPKQHESAPVPAYLVGKAWKDFGRCLDDVKNSKAEVKILVTHHNLYVEPKYGANSHNGIIKFYPEVKENFDILCCGHTHVYQNYKDDNLLVLNSGSDYNKPRYVIFEV